MSDENKSKEELIDQLVYLRHQNSILESALTEAREQIGTLLSASQHQFIGEATYSLITHLNIIKTSSYLARRIQDEGKHNQKLDMIDTQVVRLRSIIDDIITITKLDIVTMEKLVTEKARINNIIHYQLEVYQPLLQNHKRTLTTNLPSQSIILSLNVAYIQMAISQLLYNAIQYTNDEGYIDISVNVEGEIVNITITDNGIGISESDQDHIFDLFYRVDQYRPIASRSGLGLSIARAIVELHNGHITVTSKEGSGSTFTISLPKNP